MSVGVAAAGAPGAREKLPIYETVVLAPVDEPSVALSGPELISTPGSLGDPFRVIESLPGVAVVAWPAPIHAVRGANPGNTGHFLDGLQVPVLFHLVLGPSVINPYLTSSTTSTSFQAGTLQAIVGRYSYTGAVFSLLRNDLTLSYWNYQVRVNRRVGDWRLGLLLFGSDDDLEYRTSGAISLWSGNTTPSEAPESYRLQFHRASLRAVRPLGNGRLQARLAVGADRGSAPMVPGYTIGSRAHSLLPRLSYESVGRVVDRGMGLDGEVEWLHPSSRTLSAGASDLGRDRTAILGSGHVSAIIHAGDRLSLGPG